MPSRDQPLLRQYRCPGNPTALRDEATEGQDASLGDAPLAGTAAQQDTTLDRGSHGRLAALLLRPALQVGASVRTRAAVR